MSAEENKALIRRWNEEGVHNFDQYGDYLHDDYAIYDETKAGWPVGARQAGFESRTRELLSQFPTVKFQIHDIVAEGDWVAVRATWVGEDAPGYNQMQFYRIADGKIIEAWSCGSVIER
jgi:predicted SnoaL-like aldol condensation-catalyzing enzyme